MEISGNTVLITGGATGIGFALAERFVSEGSHVIVPFCSWRGFDQVAKRCELLDLRHDPP